MRRKFQSSIVAFLTLVPVTIFSLYSAPSALALNPVDYLGSAVSFGVLANAGITNTGSTTISGTAGNDVGTEPTASVTGAGSLTAGTIHQNDAVAIAAQADLTTAYTTLSGLAATMPDPGDALGGQTLGP